jgi:tRNA (mo5U34)-methyltransferase
MYTMSIAELHEEAKTIGWFHSIDLGDGHWTSGHKKPERMQAELAWWKFPADLSDKTVLDIGCADGGYSIAAMQRGARSVLSIDEQLTVGMQFLLKHKLFDLEYKRIDLFSKEFAALPMFDVIIFAGVLYHVQDPVDALKRVGSKTRELTILETHINESLAASTPYMVYYETNECNQDPTNWWGPNTLCLEAMLRTAGFHATKVFQETENTSNARVCYHLQPGVSTAQVSQRPIMGG